MKKPNFLILYVFSTFTAISVLSYLPARADEGISNKAVYHADFSDPRRFSAMLTSINNMASHYENELQDYDIRIVFVSHGIRFLTDNKLKGTPFSEDLKFLERRENIKGRLISLNKVMGVKLELCNITRSQINLPKSELYSSVDLIPSGVVRITQLQNDGFAYIKIE